MKKDLFPTFESFIQNEVMKDLNKVEESNITGRAVQAADVIVKYINKKTGKGFALYSFPEEFEREGKRMMGLRYYSAKDDSSIRINNNPSSPGLFDSISYWEAPKRNAPPSSPDYEISAPSIPLNLLLSDIANFIKQPREMEKALRESADVNEARRMRLSQDEINDVKNALSSNDNAKEVAEELGIPYKQILLVRKGIPEKEIPQESIEQNQKKLEDKILYHQTVMEDIYDITSAVAIGTFNSLFISGRAGTGKTYNVEKALKEAGLHQDRDFFYVTGSISTVELFRKLFQFRDKILVFDDADSVFSQEDGRNILKAALDSKAIRRISYFKKSKSLYDPQEFVDDPEGEQDEIDKGRIPQQFDFRGRVIFISNLKKEKADPDGAIRSRSILVDVNPDNETLIGVIEKLLHFLDPQDMPLDEKKEVFGYVKTARDISMRTFVKAAQFRQAGLPNWKRLADRYI